jgi:presqualene diphosphate synthase
MQQEKNLVHELPPVHSTAPHEQLIEVDPGRVRRRLVCHWRKDAAGTLLCTWTTRNKWPSDACETAGARRSLAIDHLVNRLNSWFSANPNSTAAPEMHRREREATALRLEAADSSFFWAMQLLSYQRREAMYALYAFCREVDDIANGNASRWLKQKLLSEWREEISLLYARRPQHECTRALRSAIVTYGLRCDDFLAIIDGMEIDARADVRAPSLDELGKYCERVAVAVGRLAVRIFGEETAAGARVAAELGCALQLTNLLRDLAEDAERGRLYLPRELLRRHGIFATEPTWVLAQPALPDVCRDLAWMAERHYAAALDAVAVCPRHAMRPAAVILHVYRALLRRLVIRGWKTLGERISVPTWHKLALLLHHGLTGR